MVALQKCLTTTSNSSGKIGLKGKKVKHIVYGIGVITGYDGTIMTVKFSDCAEVKSLNYQICMEKKLMEFTEKFNINNMDERHTTCMLVISILKIMEK